MFCSTATNHKLQYSLHYCTKIITSTVAFTLPALCTSAAQPLNQLCCRWGRHTSRALLLPRHVDITKSAAILHSLGSVCHSAITEPGAATKGAASDVVLANQSPRTYCFPCTPRSANPSPKRTSALRSRRCHHFGVVASGRGTEA